MKVNQNQSINSQIVESIHTSHTEKVTSREIKTKETTEQSSIFIKQASYRSTFSLQEFISQMQMKISSLSLFSSTNDPSIIENAMYNGLPLFNDEEKSEIFKSKNSLSSIISSYNDTIEKIRTNVTEILQSNSNSVVVASEKDIKNISRNIIESLPNSIKPYATNAILDLLK
jgi:hypothetical protein